MRIDDDDNVRHAEDRARTDKLNSEFYGRFPFPWAPIAFSDVQDDTFWPRALSYDVGDWSGSLLPPGSRIWVAGCGTNQAVMTALKFPTAQVIGSELSKSSLELARTNAEHLNLANLELRNESIGDVQYSSEFDYVVCTGVIHHNADPGYVLDRLARALKLDGLLELMVYNRYHRIQTTAVQKALQGLAGEDLALDHKTNVGLAKAVISGYWLPSSGPVREVVGATLAVPGPRKPGASVVNEFDRGELTKNSVTALLEVCKGVEEVAIADALFQPVEHSYTVESLARLCSRSGLEILGPCLNQFDSAEERLSWNIRFVDEELQKRYESLPDLARWQITNLLAQEESPRLWFYVRPAQSSRARQSEMEIVNEFRGLSLTANKAERVLFRRSADGGYQRDDHHLPFPGTPRDPLAASVVKNLGAGRVLDDVLRELGVEPTFHTVHQLRQMLCSATCPYVRPSD